MNKAIWILVSVGALLGVWYLYSRSKGSSSLLPNLAALGGYQRSDGSLVIPKTIMAAGYTPAGYHRAFNEADIGIDPSVDVWAPDTTANVASNSVYGTLPIRGGYVN